MLDLNEAKKLVGYCGAYCGGCGMYRGRIYGVVARDLHEMIRASGYANWLPQAVKLNFNFDEFLKGLEYFSKDDAECYCQVPCKEGGGAPCKIRPCAKEKGFDVCYQCKDFLCEHYAWLKEKHPRMLEDYEMFKKLGFEGWLRFHAQRAEKGYANATGKYYTQGRRE